MISATSLTRMLSELLARGIRDLIMSSDAAIAFSAAVLHVEDEKDPGTQ